MTPTPADDKAAREWADSYGQLDTLGWYAGRDGYLAGVLAERERAAKVAEEFTSFDYPECARDIADKIRSGE